MFIVEIKYVYNYIFVYACATISYSNLKSCKTFNASKVPSWYCVGDKLSVLHTRLRNKCSGLNLTCLQTMLKIAHHVYVVT